MGGSIYRGVSKNGDSGWQIVCTLKGKQTFIATVEDMAMAALIHDIISIQANGLNAKTNFSYSRWNLLAIISQPQFIDIKNLQSEA